MGGSGTGGTVGEVQEPPHVKPPGCFVRTLPFTENEMAGVDCVRKDSK